MSYLPNDLHPSCNAVGSYQVATPTKFKQCGQSRRAWLEQQVQGCHHQPRCGRAQSPQLISGGETPVRANAEALQAKVKPEQR